MRDVIEFIVHGKARPAGSKIPGVSKTGKLYVRPAAKDSMLWRNAVAASAAEVAPAVPVTGPVILSVYFERMRPASHHTAEDYSRPLKPKAPIFCTGTPDLGKCIRAIEDAMKGIIYKDDSQIVRYDTISKTWGERDKTTITVVVVDC